MCAIVGMLTCYDLRFPEVALLARQQGAEIITYPSAFATKTGMAHWGVPLHPSIILDVEADSVPLYTRLRQTHCLELEL